jgi:hypothetical protein
MLGHAIVSVTYPIDLVASDFLLGALLDCQRMNANLPRVRRIEALDEVEDLALLFCGKLGQRRVVGKRDVGSLPLL